MNQLNKSLGKKNSRRIIVLLLMLGISLALCIIAVTQGFINPKLLRTLVEESGSMGMVVYVLCVVVLEIFWFPRMWGLMAGGILFGPVAGGFLSLIADMSGGTACYLISRSAGKEWIQGVLANRPKARKVVDLLTIKRGTFTVAFLRIFPLGHYTTVSYASGLTGVPKGSFLLGTAIGIIPGAILYPSLGDAALSPSSPAFMILMVCIILVMVVSFYVGGKLFKETQKVEEDK